MVKQVEIVDSPMGTGKSTAIMDWMSNQPNKRFIYVSPLLSEVEAGGRLHRSVKGIDFHAPEDFGEGKSASMLSLLRAGANVSCTHSLYKLMTEEHFSAIGMFDYTLIIDEEVGLIEAFRDYSLEDLKWLINQGFIRVSQTDGMVEWVNDGAEVKKPTHKYYRLRQMCEAGCLYTTKRSDTMLTIQLPTKLLDCAKRTIILTYMYQGNILDSFLKLKGFTSIPFTEPLSLQPFSGAKIRGLLTITPPPKNFNLRNRLSYSWYLNPNKGELNVVKNAIIRTCKNWGITSKDVLYTFPKYRSVSATTRSEKIKPAGYTYRPDGSPCWLAVQMRATNDYCDTTHMIHAYNRHTNVVVASYLQDFDCPVNGDVFALSELIQFLWRGCIRNGQPMHVCIFSARMEKLLRNWLDGLPN